MTSEGDGQLGECSAEDGDRIQVLRPRLPPAERLLSYLQRIDAARTYTNWGPLACELEVRLAGVLGSPPEAVVSASSGTAALVGAILGAAGRATGVDDLAIVPAFTFVATALATELCGFSPLPGDIDADTWALCAESVEAHPNLRRVRLVVPVAPFGRAVPQAPWLEFHRRTGIPVVIDGGASFEALAADPGRYVGAIPVALSFHATKSFSTAEGGCVIATDTALMRRVCESLNFGFFNTRSCVRASTNGKLSEYHAAIGLAELDAWPQKHADLEYVAHGYLRRLTAAGLADRLLVAPAIASCYALFRCTDIAEATRVQDSLDRANIEWRLWYGRGLHTHPHYAGTARTIVPVTDALSPRLIALPVAPDLSDQALDRIVSGLVAGVTKPQ